MNFKQQPKGFATKAIHAGQNPEQWRSKCVVPPIVMSSTFKQRGLGEHDGFEYSRSGNPTREVLEKCLASLDDAKYGLTFSSGLGATSAVLSMLNNGDHIIVSDDMYGGTNRLIRQVAVRFGIEFSFIDMADISALQASIKDNTKMIWVETPTNPLFKLADIEEISKVAHNVKDMIFAVDNTFLTAYFQRPLELGADLVCYSLSKYVNGHSDIIMGGVTTNSEILFQKLKFLQNAMGIIPSPFDCYQVNRGIKTLAIRMEQHQKSSLEIGKFLENHHFVDKVLHPALPSHPQHQLALKQTYGFSGVFSFYIKGDLSNSEKFLKALKIFTLAESLGGYESLAELPLYMTHASVPAADRERLGITSTLIRLSVGLEDLDYLIEDVKQALAAAEMQ